MQDWTKPMACAAVAKGPLPEKKDDFDSEDKELLEFIRTEWDNIGTIDDMASKVCHHFIINRFTVVRDRVIELCHVVAKERIPDFGKVPELVPIKALDDPIGEVK